MISVRRARSSGESDGSAGASGSGRGLERITDAGEGGAKETRRSGGVIDVRDVVAARRLNERAFSCAMVGVFASASCSGIGAGCGAGVGVGSSRGGIDPLS